MTYPGTVKPTFQEIYERQAAEGNPLAKVMLERKKRGQKFDPKKESKIQQAIQQAKENLPPVDPEIEAQIEAEKQPEEPVYMEPIPKQYPDFDPKVDDGIPF